jgi:dTDP-4-dehydrorhamnose 3,5-epimerase
MPVPQLLDGDLVVDDRGELGFVNEFRFQGVKRFYWLTTHKTGFVRAWHAHRHEGKYFLAVQGAALVGLVEIDDWNNPSKDTRVFRYVLSARKPSVLCIPPGYANGFMSLTKDAKLLVFSTLSLEESKNDDVRYPARYWDIWAVPER